MAVQYLSFFHIMSLNWHLSSSKSFTSSFVYWQYVIIIDRIQSGGKYYLEFQNTRFVFGELRTFCQLLKPVIKSRHKTFLGQILMENLHKKIKKIITGRYSQSINAWKFTNLSFLLPKFERKQKSWRAHIYHLFVEIYFLKLLLFLFNNLIEILLSKPKSLLKSLLGIFYTLFAVISSFMKSSRSIKFLRLTASSQSDTILCTSGTIWRHHM